jgi:non-canonical purine NTP pyrophosphatase (RdgB/HAM1 family)
LKRGKYEDLVFITGNQHKANYLAKWLGMPVPHRKVDQDEIQSLDLREVVEHKARQAYEIVKKPVLVEDVALTFTAMGRLPGTLIKWFLEEMGNEKLCGLAKGLSHQQAISEMEYAIYDGTEMHFFSGVVQGRISGEPRGDSFGWNNIFIPDGHEQTYGEMTEEQFNICSHRAHAIAKLRAYLQKT